MFGDFWSSDTNTTLRFNGLVKFVGESIDKIITSALDLEPNTSTDVDAHSNSRWPDTVTRKNPRWTIEVATIGDKCSMTKLEIPIKKSGETWNVDKGAIEAVLGMWFAQLHQDGLSRDWIPYKEEKLWLLPSADDNEYEVWQALLEFLDIRQPQLIPVGNAVEACEQHHIDIRRVFDAAPFGDCPIRTVRRAMTIETDMFEMCGQYLVMSFFAQNAALIKKRTAALSLKSPIDDLGHLVLIHDPLFEDLRDCLSQTAIFPVEAMGSFAFCVLSCCCQRF